MPDTVDLYNSSYGHSDAEVYTQVRLETYGVDIGQTSWVTRDELEEIPRLLKIDGTSNVLEIGSGAGGCALAFAESIGCRVAGLDVNPHGIHAAEQSAQSRGLSDRVSFVEHNAGKALPFPQDTFDAAYSNDAFCHIPNRLRLLEECRRVLKPGARLLFSDALVVSGAVTAEEIAARSSIGYYLFVPRGENESLIAEAGLELVLAHDATAHAAAISQRWHDARARRKHALVQMEGEANFEGLQRFLACVHKLTAEKRLARFVYVAAK